MPTYDHSALKIYTDGSARPRNPGPGGAAFVLEYPERLNKPNIQFKYGYIESTNNRMEMIAAIHALEYIRENLENIKKLDITRILLITDSQYLYNHTNSLPAWRKREKETGQSIPNKDLWKKFLSLRLATRIQVEFKWELGKISEITKLVDKLAKSASKFSSYKDFGYIKPKINKSLALDQTSISIFPAMGTEEIIHIFQYKPLDLKAKEYKVSFDLWDTHKNLYLNKFYAFTKGEIGVKLKRGHKYYVKFDTNTERPAIVEAVDFID